MIKVQENKRKEGLGFNGKQPAKVAQPTKGTFRSGGFIHALEDDAIDDVEPALIIPGGVCNNWVTVDVPFVIHQSK